MTSVLVVLGAMREVIGNGTLFDGADLLLAAGQVPCVLKYSSLITASYWRYFRRCLYWRWLLITKNS